MSEWPSMYICTLYCLASVVCGLFFFSSVSRKHDQRLSIKTGSWFFGSNITLAEGLKAIYLWSCGLTQKQVRRELPLAKQTVGDLFCFLREICASVVITHATPLGGLDKNGNPIIVEIDESKFGKIKYNRVSCICTSVLSHVLFLSFFLSFFLFLSLFLSLSPSVH